MSQILDVTQVVPGNVATAFESWIKIVWKEGGGMGSAEVIEEGDSTYAGCTRRVTFGIVEKILSTDKPKKITYTIASGAIPLKTHLGEVTFEEGDGVTTINWRCTYTPFFGFGWIMGPVIRHAFQTMLSNLKKSMDKATATPNSS